MIVEVICRSIYAAFKNFKQTENFKFHPGSCKYPKEERNSTFSENNENINIFIKNILSLASLESDAARL